MPAACGTFSDVLIIAAARSLSGCKKVDTGSHNSLNVRMKKLCGRKQQNDVKMQRLQ